MKKAIIALIVLGALGGGGYAFYLYSQKPPEPTVNFASITRGDIIDTVGATGQLEPVEKVQVGTQVSGVVQELHADFNSVVRKGQLLAVLDPQLIQTQILQQEANYIRSQTDVERNQTSLEDAKRKFDRTKELFDKGIVNRSEYDTSDIQLRSAQSSLKSSEAALKQSDAQLKQQQVNLTYTKIYSPIDGIVVSRVVDVGQTLNAGQQAPTLFNLAADLAEMRIVAGVDESDVGRIRPNQHVSFTIDAYPNENFTGTVTQVRLEPRLNQNVVTYQTVIIVPNHELKLKPGMTANLKIEISRRDDVLRVPNSALRFRPTNDMYAVLGLTPPTPETGRGRGGPGAPGTPGAGGGGRSNGNGESSPTATPGPGAAPAGPSTGTQAPAGATASAAPSGNRGSGQSADRTGSGQRGSGGTGRGMTQEEREARMRNMTPEERERMMARGGGRGGSSRGASGRGNTGRGGQNAQGRGRGGNQGGSTLTAAELASQRNITTIDNLFPPLPPVESRGRVWTWDKDKKELKSISLRLGITDGQSTQLLEGDVKEGQQIVTNVVNPLAVRPGFNPQQQGNPFFQQGGGGGRGPGGGGGGNPGGGGGGGGGGNRGGGGGGGRGGF